MIKMPYAELGKSHIFYQFYKSEGIPLVFIHGWAGDSTKWESQIKFFLGKYPVIVYDLEGHGKSVKITNYSIKHHSQILHALLDFLGLKQVHLVGHSMGGMIAQQYAIDHPDRLQKLILISTTTKIITSFKKRLTTLLMRLLLRVSFRKFFKILFSYTQAPEISSEKLDALLERANEIPPKVIRKTFKEMTSYNSSKKLSTFNKPTLIMVGEKDPIISSQMVQTLHQIMPNSTLKIIQNGYHEIIIENSNLVNRTIQNFIEEN